MPTLTLASMLLDWRGPVGRSGRLLISPRVAGAVPHLNAVRRGGHVRPAPAEPAHHAASRRWRCCHRVGALGPWLCRWVPGNGILHIPFPSLISSPTSSIPKKNVLIKTNNPGISYCILLAGPCGRTGCTACQVPSPHKSLGDGAAPRRRLHHRFSHGRSRRALLDARHRHPGPIEGLPREKRPPAPDATEMRPDLPLTWAVGPTSWGDQPGARLEPSSDPVSQPSMTFLCWRGSLLDSC